MNYTLGLGSFLDDKINKVDIIHICDTGDTKKFVKKCSFDHQYPPTKLMWLPNESSANKDVMATSGEYLRIYGLEGTYHDQPKLLCELKNNKPEYSAPLTSFDWNIEDNQIIGTCSIDTTCTVWDLEKAAIKT